MQFVTTPAQVNLGLYSPSQFTGPQARAVQAVYVNGNYSDAGADSLAALVTFSARGQTGSLNRLATPKQVGSLWGLAFDRNNQRLFAAAVAKRHSALGPQGPGGIYLITPAAYSVQPFINLDQLGIPTAPAHLSRDLSGSITSVSHDSLMYSLVGKISLGGMDVSDDGRELFVVNLFDRKLYRILLPADGSQPSAADITGYSLPEPGGKGGTFRPFAVKYFAGKLYVGGVCDAQHSDRASDLKAIVYSATYAGNDSKKVSFDEVATIGLNYARGVLDYKVSGWYPWTDDYQKAVVKDHTGWQIRPQPILADIEFDTDGSMILGLMDRLGHQTADGQYYRPKGSKHLQQYRGLSGGDVLRVAFVNNRYQLEQNGRAGDRTSEGQGNRQGPAGGEFYFDDGFTASGVTWHQETATGGLAMLPELNQLLVAAREPEVNQYVTGGVKWFSNLTGKASAGLSVFPSGERAGYVWKANSVGDVELITEVPSTQFGDRVWQDCNENGVQDADEPGLANIELQLYHNGKQLAMTRTDANGRYVFDDANVSGGIKAATAYEIQIPLQQSSKLTLQLIQAKGTLTGETAWPMELDNDAVQEEERAIIRFKTGTAGEHLQHLDAGFKCIDKPQITARYTCTNTTSGPVIRLLIEGNSLADKVVVTPEKAFGSADASSQPQPIPAGGMVWEVPFIKDVSQQASVRVIAPSGCYTEVSAKLDQAACMLMLSQANSQYTEQAKRLSVTPNPTSGEATVDYKGFAEAGPIKINVVNAEGHLVQSRTGELQGGLLQQSLNLLSVPAGVYFVVVTEGTVETSSRIIKQ
ncbi:hypothetical protein GCM10023189_32980 [Nibrella saemangeumensis]|uniref:Por secretion system C-terminal sorting domain-containing protein n=1 Tax=Nibrella saemangeumensis TaxID=1084526 RepID=A0ABP8N4T0_9BACT